MCLPDRATATDTPADEEFNDFVEIGRRAFGTRICAINFIDRDRQWAKSICGLDLKVAYSFAIPANLIW